MSWLLDVNLLLACGWRTHRDHAAANAWLARQRRFATCAITELGFLRVSMSPGYRASFGDAQAALAQITSLRGAAFLMQDLPVARVPEVASHADTTDAYLVALSRGRNLKLATLDTALTGKPWAAGIAENPLQAAG